VSSAATAPASPTLVAKTLKPIPLLGCQHGLQTTISLASNLFHARLGLTSHSTQLLARVVEDLLHLRLLIRR
jgi:hypothetical protein